MRKAQFWTVTNATKDSVICAAAHKADSWWERLHGLLGEDGLSKDSGLLISPSSGVHTFGMKFPIDIIVLDRNLRVLSTWKNVGPKRICGVSLRTRSVLELRSGRVCECSVTPGDQLLVAPVACEKAA